jgi:hypothetical protein
MGDETLAAWTTESSCYLEVLSTMQGGESSHVNYPCSSPRVSADPATGTAKVLFEADTTIRLMNVAHGQMGGDSMLIRPRASSPRTVFDGTRHWVSYIDIRGDVVVGYLNNSNELISSALNDPRPNRQAYELAMIDGAPWVVSLDSTGYSAQRMCLTTLW